jgi:hypothetical protein
VNRRAGLRASARPLVREPPSTKDAAERREHVKGAYRAHSAALRPYLITSAEKVTS